MLAYLILALYVVWRVRCSAQVTIINFTVTTTGLEDQLLVDVVKNERPDLEAKKDELVRNGTLAGDVQTGRVWSYGNDSGASNLLCHDNCNDAKGQIMCVQ